MKQEDKDVLLFGGIGMLAAHIGAVYLVQQTKWMYAYLVCLLAVFGLMAMETKLLHQRIKSVRVYMHTCLPFLLQNLLVLLADAGFCALQYAAILKKGDAVFSGEWNLFIGMIPIVVLQILSAFVVFVIGAARTMLYHDEQTI